MSHVAPNPDEYAALSRLLHLAGNDTPQARCVADFLLAWWNAPDYGGFDFQGLWELKRDQVADVLTVTAYLARAGHGPGPLGLEENLRRLARQWRR